MATENQKKLRLCVEEYKEMKKNGTTENDHDNEESSIDIDVGNGIPAHLAVPSQQVVASVLLQKKKAALLDRFA